MEVVNSTLSDICAQCRDGAHAIVQVLGVVAGILGLLLASLSAYGKATTAINKEKVDLHRAANQLKQTESQWRMGSGSDVTKTSPDARN